MDKYSMIVSWSDDDNCYIVSVPDLPGYMVNGEILQPSFSAIQMWLRAMAVTAVKKACGIFCACDRYFSDQQI